jgi:hypothetical protein
MSPNVHFPTSRRAKLVAASLAAALGLSGVTAVAAFAASGPSSTAPPAPAAASAAPKTATPNQLATAKDRVNLSVDRRSAALDQLATRSAADPGLSAADHSTVTADIAAARAALTSLKTKVDAETTIRAIQADVRAAKTAAKADPAITQAGLLARGYGSSAVLDRVDASVARLKARLQAAQAAGTDVTKALAALSDMQAKAADARGQLTGFAKSVLSGQAGATKSASALDAVKTDLKAIKTDTKTIRAALPAAAGKAKSAKKANGTPPTSTP